VVDVVDGYVNENRSVSSPSEATKAGRYSPASEKPVTQRKAPGPSPLR
jgi:hypothetical protein